MSATGSRDPTYVQIGDAYFRRFLVPIVITILIFLAAVAIIVVPPGTQAASSMTNFAVKAFGSSS